MEFVLIPFRGLAGGKQRLRDVLSRDDRTALAWAMLGDVVDAVVASTRSPHIVVVTQNPSAVRAFLSSDVTVIPDPSEGLNAAVAAGFAHVAEQAGANSPVLSVAADLPLLRSVTIDRALAAVGAEDTLVLAPALADGGTNLFGQTAACRVAPAFGPQSFRAHVAAAAKAGLAVRLIEDAGAGRDIDRRDDFLALAAASHAARSVRFARACEVGAAAPT